MNRCQSCGSLTSRVLSLGYLPPCNDYDAIGSKRGASAWLPTDLLWCPACELVQLEYEADPSTVFPPSYPYTSGTTKMLRDNFADLAAEVNAIVGRGGMIVDVGSNDGTLLSNFRGWKTVGVEPTDVADIANSRGVETIKKFFGRQTAREIAAVYGQAKVVTCANCFAHMPHVDDVVGGVLDLLAPDGIFVTESHYLIGLLNRLQYDTIYHEHLRYYSLTSLSNLLAARGLEVFHARPIPSHGGSIRVYAARKGQRPPRSSVAEVLAGEPTGENMASRLAQFAQDVRGARSRLLASVDRVKASGGRVAAVSAPSRAATVVNYCRLDADRIEYVCEVPGSLKIGKYMPGTSIPVVDEKLLFEDRPEAVVLFSWHIAGDLIPKLRAKGYGGEFILPCARAGDPMAEAA